MTPQEAQELAGQLRALSAEGWLALLLAREGGLPPRMLSFLAQLPGQYDGDAATLLQTQLPVLDELPPVTDTRGHALPWAEGPLRQVERVVDALLAAHGLPRNAAPETLDTGPDTANMTIRAQRHLSQAMGLAAHWLQEAARCGATGDASQADPAHRAPWRG